jgi:hypothetical protein
MIDLVSSPAPRDVWIDVAKADPDALPFSTPAWTDAICSAGGYADASRLYRTADGHWLVLPLVRRVRLPIQASMPDRWGSGGLICTRPLRPDDVTAVLDDVRRGSAASTAIRPNPVVDRAWSQAAHPGAMRIPRLSHVLDLEGGMEAVWTKRISTSTRTKLRRAARSGVVVERETGRRAVDTFYEVYLAWLAQRARERRMPLRLALWRGRRREPFAKFGAVADVLGDGSRIWVARRDGRPAAVAIILVHGTNAVYWRSASDRELVGSTRANDLLQQRAIEDACALGCLTYHMGESGGVRSLMHFKERFGAKPFAYAEYRLERLPLARAQRAARGMAAAVERRVIRAGAS